MFLMKMFNALPVHSISKRIRVFPTIIRTISDDLHTSRKTQAIMKMQECFGPMTDTEAEAKIETFYKARGYLAEASKGLQSVNCWFSHAWDKSRENILVKTLGGFLKICGHEIYSDQDGKHAQLIQRFMQRFGEVKENKIILVVCSKKYIERLLEPAFFVMDLEHFTCSIQKPDDIAGHFTPFLQSHNIRHAYFLVGSDLYYLDKDYNLDKEIGKSFHVNFSFESQCKLLDKLRASVQPLFGNKSLEFSHYKEELAAEEVAFIESLTGTKTPQTGVKTEYEQIIKKWVDHKEEGYAQKVIPVVMEKGINIKDYIPRELKEYVYIDFTSETVSDLEVLFDLVDRIQCNFSDKVDSIKEEKKYFTDWLSQASKRYEPAYIKIRFLTSHYLSSEFHKIIAKASPTLYLPYYSEGDKTYPGLKPRYDYFFGRDDDFSNIKKIISSKGQCFLLDPSGKGGKSFIANEFAYRQLSEGYFKFVYWLEDCSKDDLIKSNLLRVLKFDNPFYDKEESIEELRPVHVIFKDFLEAIPRDNSRILIVYDNLGSVQRFGELRKNGLIAPNNPLIHSLFILDGKKSVDKNKTCEIKHDRNWGIGYLNKKLSMLSQGERDFLAKHGCNYTVILYQLANFIQYEIQNGKSKNDIMMHIRRCLKEERKNSQELISRLKISDFEFSNEKIKLAIINFRVILRYYREQSVKKEKNRYQLMQQILYFCSLLGGERIPKKIIQNWLQSSGAVFVDDTIKLLTEIKLFDIDRTDDGKYAVIYGVTQTAALYDALYKGSLALSKNLYYLENLFGIAIRVLIKELEYVREQDKAMVYRHVEALIEKIHNPKLPPLKDIKNDCIDKYALAMLQSKLAEYHLTSNVNKDVARERVEQVHQVARDICETIHKYFSLKKGHNGAAFFQASIPCPVPVCPLKSEQNELQYDHRSRENV